jgi:hypothetical protein
MKRLREEIDSPDPLVAEAARLLASQLPVESSPGRRARIWAALSRRRGPRPGTLALRWALRSAVLVPLSLLALATVAAALWAGVVAPRRTRLGGHDAGRVGPTRPARVRASPAPAPPASPLPEASPPAGPPVVPLSVKHPAPPASRAQPPRLEADVAFAPSAEGEPESALVLGALTALRRDRDPRRASALLDEYLRLHPRGALVEEALALAIEAAAARGDPQAGALADRYLERFPAGRFRPTAQLARDRFQPASALPAARLPGGPP